MAVAGIQISINTDEFRNFRDQLARFFPPRQATPIMAAAIRKAIQPTTQRLRAITPVGPTGNLRRAVTSKVVQYRNDGVAVGIVGYTRAGKQTFGSAAGGTVRAGKDRGFHQWWLEYGTDERKLLQSPKRRKYMRRSPTAAFSRTRVMNGKTVTDIVRGKGVLHEVQEQTETYIASSFNKLGPFKILKSVGGGRVQTDPAYPRAFFRKSNEPIRIPAMPAGGSQGIPPVQTAFRETESQMATILQQELRLSLEEAWAALRFRSSGSASGTDTLGGA